MYERVLLFTTIKKNYLCMNVFCVLLVMTIYVYEPVLCFVSYDYICV